MRGILLWLVGLADPGDHPALRVQRDLTSRSGRTEHRSAFGRQVGQQDRLCRRARRLGLPGLLAEPPGQVFAAAIAGRRGHLVATRRFARWTGEADMKVGVMPIPGPDAMQPCTVGPGTLAHGFLDPGMDEDARDRRIQRGTPDQRDMGVGQPRRDRLCACRPEALTLPTAPPDQSSLGVGQAWASATNPRPARSDAMHGRFASGHPGAGTCRRRAARASHWLARRWPNARQMRSGPDAPRPDCVTAASPARLGHRSAGPPRRRDSLFWHHLPITRAFASASA